jgi:hypothetical protein
MKKERHDGSGHVGSFVSPVEKGGGSAFGSQSGQSVEWRAYALCADWNMGPRRGGGFGGSAGRRSAEPPPPGLPSSIGSVRRRDRDRSWRR